MFQHMRRQPSYTKFERQVLAEVRAEVLDTSPVTRLLGFVAFVSKSNGRGRRPRKPRTVEMVYHNGRAIKASNRAALDQIAHDAGIVAPDHLGLADFVLETLRTYGSRKHTGCPARKPRKGN